MLGDLVDNVERVIRGKRQVVETVVASLLARGHVLIEDVPGVGKTMLARALARSIRADFRRIQCTPDLLPSDITGVSVFDPRVQAFEFRPGPVFTQVLLCDEINRATPRTQSALLEAMEERQVTVDGSARALGEFFFLIATENPIELAGTFPLPEAQLDRFLVQVTLGYPADAVEVEILAAQQRDHPIESLEPVAGLEELRSFQKEAREKFVHPSVLSYIQRIAAATRKDERVACGASPRGALGLVRASQAMALLEGEPFVAPDHVKRLAPDVLGHRLVLEPRARVQGKTGRAVVQEILRGVPAPVEWRGEVEGRKALG